MQIEAVKNARAVRVGPLGSLSIKTSPAAQVLSPKLATGIGVGARRTAEE